LTYYLYTGAANTDQPYVGRFDSIELALKHTSSDPLKLAFGYGAGNVTESFLPQFGGRYWDYYVRFGVGQTQVTQFLWEVGVVGLSAFLFLFYLVWRDALTLARSKDEMADLGQLWVVAMIVMTFGLLYKSLLSMNDFGYLFWYFSGLVASRAAFIRQEAARRVKHRAPANWRLAIDGPPAHVKG
jgi:O-antigen ligase